VSNGYRRLAPSANPTAIDPPSGTLVNWNNAIARGWRVAAGDWESGPVVRATILQDLLGLALHRGRLDLAGITGAVTAPSLTPDVRGYAVWPWLRRVIGHSRDAHVRQLVAMLSGWAAAGSQRRSTQSANVVDDSPAVLLMDTWWPLLVRAEFQPVVGAPLIDPIARTSTRSRPTGSETGPAQFLRQLVDGRAEGSASGAQAPGRRSLLSPYCGRGSLRRCRALLDGHHPAEL